MISSGRILEDLANGVLEYLDFEVIKRNYKPFFGYSDLTTIINAIYAQTGKCSYLYQIRNLSYRNRERQIKGILLGTFTTLDGKSDMPSVEELIKYIVSNPNLPIARTRNIGHGSDSKCIVIGKEIVLRNTCSRSGAKHSRDLVLIK